MNFANFPNFLAFFRIKDRKKNIPIFICNLVATQSMKSYQVLVHSFVRNQPERRWGQFLLKFLLFSHSNDTFLQCIGLSIYIKSRKVRRIPSLSHRRFSDEKVGELDFSTAHGHYILLVIMPINYFKHGSTNIFYSY